MFTGQPSQDLEQALALLVTGLLHAQSQAPTPCARFWCRTHEPSPRVVPELPRCSRGCAARRLSTSRRRRARLAANTEPQRSCASARLAAQATRRRDNASHARSTVSRARAAASARHSRGGLVPRPSPGATAARPPAHERVVRALATNGRRPMRRPGRRGQQRVCCVEVVLDDLTRATQRGIAREGIVVADQRLFEVPGARGKLAGQRGELRDRGTLPSRAGSRAPRRLAARSLVGAKVDVQMSEVGARIQPGRTAASSACSRAALVVWLRPRFAEIENTQQVHGAARRAAHVTELARDVGALLQVASAQHIARSRARQSPVAKHVGFFAAPGTCARASVSACP